tara:strand:- start:385 stop:828 length:444 start_codon:yes stop_codon:yes gene_type:complete
MGQSAEVQVQYTHNDVHSVNVVDPITDEVFRAFVSDPNIKPGTTLAELKVQQGSTYANKGFTGKRTARSSQTFTNANEAHDEKVRGVISRSSQRAPTNAIHAELMRIREEEHDTHIPGDTRHLVSTEPLEPRAEEYGTDGEYEDDKR